MGYGEEGDDKKKSALAKKLKLRIFWIATVTFAVSDYASV